MTKHICDLCGKEIHKYETMISMTSGIVGPGLHRGYDFHENCWNRMKEIIKAEEVKRK